MNGGVRSQRRGANFRGQVVARGKLPVAGVGHVRIYDRLECRSVEQRRQLREEALERGPVEVDEEAVLSRDGDRREVDIELEVHGLGGVARLAHELSTLDVDPDHQPAHDAHE